MFQNVTLWTLFGSRFGAFHPSYLHFTDLKTGPKYRLRTNELTNHRALISKISAQNGVRTEPPLGVGGWSPDLMLLRHFEQFLKLLRKNMFFLMFLMEISAAGPKKRV